MRPVNYMLSGTFKKTALTKNCLGLIKNIEKKI